MTALYVILSIFPIVDVKNPVSFTAKVILLILGINAAGAWYFRRVTRHREDRTPVAIADEPRRWKESETRGKAGMTMGEPERAARAIQALAEAKVLLGNRVTAAEAVREHHGHGEDKLGSAPPDLVCFPQSTEEVSRIVCIAAVHGLPIFLSVRAPLSRATCRLCTAAFAST